jgi:hypothetical protein
MYKLFAVLFFLGFFYSEADGCEWWNKRVAIQPVPVVVSVPQMVYVPMVVQYPVIVYQPVVVQEVRLLPVVENKVIYQPVIRYNY